MSVGAGACVLLLWGGLGCGGAAVEGRGGAEEARDPHRLYPLEEGHVWAFQVEDGEGMRALAQSRVVAFDGRVARVSQNGGAELRYELRPEGIYRPDDGVWLLRAPLREGAHWPSMSGRTAHVLSVGERVEVPAGRFEGCVRIEERGGGDGRRIVTVYCPDVGPVWLETSVDLPAAGRSVRIEARLLGHSAPSDR